MGQSDNADFTGEPSFTVSCIVYGMILDQRSVSCLITATRARWSNCKWVNTVIYEYMWMGASHVVSASVQKQMATF